jgi:cellulose synthase operon protein YhjQ
MSRRRCIAFVTPLGGTGQTTLIATVATLLAQQGTPCFAVDLCAENGLGLHLGLQQPATSGWAAAAAAGQWWADAALENSDRVGYLPFGEAAPAELQRLHGMLEQSPQWLQEQLEDLALDDSGLLLLDTPPWPSVQARQALACADMVIVCLDATFRACKAHATVQSMLSQARPAAGLAVMLTGLDPRYESQRSPLQILRQQWTAWLIPYALHRDENIPYALAQSGCVSTQAPQSQAAHDLQGVSRWLLQHSGDARGPLL